MSVQQIDEILAATFADRRLSRGEKRVLSAALSGASPNANELAQIRHRAFQMARSAVADSRDRALIDWLEDVTKVLSSEGADGSADPRARAWFSPGDACLNRIIGLFRDARESADICVFTITDNRIGEAIVQAHKRGVRCRIITDNDKAEDRGSDVDALERAGIPVRVDRTEHHMHHKFALFDRGALLTGSYNWTRSAALYNQENVLITRDEGLTQAFSGEFERLWDALK